MTTTLKLLNPNAVIPAKVSNLTQKVQKYLLTNGDQNMIISGFETNPCVAADELGPYCHEVGITPEQLINEHEPIILEQSQITKGLIYELEKYRKISYLVTSVVIKRSERIWGATKFCESSLKSSWSRIYSKVTSMKKCHKKIEMFLAEKYELPIMSNKPGNNYGKQMCEKENT